MSRLSLAGGTILLFGGIAQAGAASFDTGSGVRLRWDNTVTTSLGIRVNSPDGELLSDANADDGDRAFAHGVVSERVDLLSELDVSAGELGFNLSAAGWYDAAYYGRTANTSPITFNPQSVPHTALPGATRTLEGGSAELLSAYVHDRLSLGEVPLTVRLGRQTLLWGESVFFPQNGIAGGQAPYDVAKALANPLAQAKELYLPVAQAVAILQVRPGLGLQAFIQAEWRPDRLPGVGSFASTADYLDAGGERLFTSGGGYFRRGRDIRPSGAPQFGVALRLTGPSADVGLYGLRFDAKTPEVFVSPYATPYGRDLGKYGLIYPQGIELYGASFSTYLGDNTVAGEVSYRRHMPLVSGAIAYEYGLGGNVPYAVGDTLHGLLSMTATVPQWRFWPGGILQGEVSADDRLTVTRHSEALAPGVDRFASMLRVVYAPQFFQVLPRLDLTVPVGVAYGLAGNSSVFGNEVAHAGDVDIALDLTWRVVWQGAVAFTHYLGNSTRQPASDRDLVTISLSRTF